LKVGEEIKRREARDEREWEERRLLESGLPVAYRHGARSVCDLPPACADALSLCHLLGEELRGMYLSGGAGTFKTSIAASWLAQEVRKAKDSKQLSPGRYVFVPDLLSDVHASYRNDDGDSRAALVSRCVNARWLVLDDLGKEKASPHAAGVIFEILDGRYRNYRAGQWLIVASNFDLDALCDRFPSGSDDDFADPIRRRISELTVNVPMEAA
jgi:DNA replication protein DnaC